MTDEDRIIYWQSVAERALDRQKEMESEHNKIVGKLIETLEECADYFDNRADANCDQDGLVRNKEMRLLAVVQAALSIAEHSKAR